MTVNLTNINIYIYTHTLFPAVMFGNVCLANRKVGKNITVADITENFDICYWDRKVNMMTYITNVIRRVGYRHYLENNIVVPLHSFSGRNTMEFCSCCFHPKGIILLLQSAAEFHEVLRTQFTEKMYNLLLFSQHRKWITKMKSRLSDVMLTIDNQRLGLSTEA